MSLSYTNTHCRTKGKIKPTFHGKISKTQVHTGLQLTIWASEFPPSPRLLLYLIPLAKLKVIMRIIATFFTENLTLVSLCKLWLFVYKNKEDPHTSIDRSAPLSEFPSSIPICPHRVRHRRKFSTLQSISRTTLPHPFAL